MTSRMNEFHPLIQSWFSSRFDAPTGVQERAWPSIRSGQNTLLAAPTGSGKTLSAFLVGIDQLIRADLDGQLDDKVQMIYVSPLKALSNDIQKNLEAPLRELEEHALTAGYMPTSISVKLRTGDSTNAERQALVRKPPHILVTTPESLFLLLTGKKSRDILRNVKSVVVDEIHSLARDKRGSHLSLSLERLDHLCGRKPQRIGLSATQSPIEDIARFLCGKQQPCEIINEGHIRKLDLGIEVPPSELSSVCSHEQWAEIHTRLHELIDEHRSTLIFVNTRKMAERLSYKLSEELGENAVASHHGSLSKEIRHDAEQRLKNGTLKAIVATASLELGIDIGYIDLVCQIGSPRSIATFLQRIGRSGHNIGATPKARIFALSRDELLEAFALCRAIKRGRLDAIEIPYNALDILAQQIVATCANEQWNEDDLYQLVTESSSYADLTREDFDSVIRMLSDGFSQADRRFAYLHRDGIHKSVSARKGARLAAVMNAGAIPEQALYRVVNIDDGAFVGTVDEDFAIERQPGHVFLLGNTSWMIQHVRGTTVSVRDANGSPPTAPFWFGEAPGRSIELSEEISSIRLDIGKQLPEIPDDDPVTNCEYIKDVMALDPAVYKQARQWLADEVDDNDWAGLQAIHYIAVQQSAMGILPSQQQVVFERFFDETAGMQLVIHAPFGMRVNRAWGLSIRKSFCRSFDFELQALADDDGIVLSLGRNQSFPIDQLFGFLRPENVRRLLEQAFLQVPLFQARWRWNCNRSLAVLKMRSGKKIPPALQRFRAEDLLTAVFPASTQCFEHITGDIDIPYEHPLVKESMENCLYEAADLKRFTEILQKIQDGAIELVARESREPSPFAYERLNANSYAFLDDAPLEDRRTRALQQRRHFSIDDFKDLRQLDVDAIKQVRDEAWPIVRDKEEMHEALLCMGIIAESEYKQWQLHLDALIQDQRACYLHIDGKAFCCAAEYIPMVSMVYEDRVSFASQIDIPQEFHDKWDCDKACSFIVRSRVAVKPIIPASDIADYTLINLSMVEAQLQAIEAEGELIRGSFSDNAIANETIEWCERRMLQRIHRMTIDGLRERIKPVSVKDYMRFLFRYQGIISQRQDRQGLIDTVAQLQGFESAAGAWEKEIFALRIEDYQQQFLDDICSNGMLVWGRMQLNSIQKGLAVNRSVPIALCMREDLEWILPAEQNQKLNQEQELAPRSLSVYQALIEHGAQFTHELQQRSQLLPTELEDCLADLVRRGLVSADNFAALRPFLRDSKHKNKVKKYKQAGPLGRHHYRAGGRWTLFPGLINQPSEQGRVEAWAWQLLDRYGVVCRDILAREQLAPAWGELSRFYRQLEHRGEIRGGRFISGVGGEQFAREGIIEELRRVRDQRDGEELVVISAADPLNLVGILSEGKRIGHQRNVTLLYRRGEYLASFEDGDVHFHAQVAADNQWFYSKLLQAPPATRRELIRQQDDIRRKHA